MGKKKVQFTERQAWRLWLCIHDLQEYLNDYIEAGANTNGLKKDFNEAKKCKKLIQRQRSKLDKP